MSVRSAVVIGGGVVGACCAWFLARRGVAVTLLDQTDLAAGASMGNAGLISVGHLPMNKPGLWKFALRSMFDARSPLYVKPRLDPGLARWFMAFARACRPEALQRNMRTITAISARTIELFDLMQREAGLRFEYQRGGYMDVYRNPESFRKAQEESEFITRQGFPEEVLSPAQVYDAEPALAPGIVGAVRHITSGFADPGAFVHEVARDARDRLRVQLRTGVRARSFIRESGRVVGVRAETSAGIEEFRADVAVLCAGPWSSALARDIGLRLPIEPAKGYHLMLRAPAGLIRRAVLLGDSYVVCTPMQGMVRLAGTLEFSGLNHKFDERRVSVILERACAEVPGLRGAEVASRWCGLRPCLPDGLPAVGWTARAPGVYVAAGHAMMGFWTAPATGLLASEQILGDAPSIDPAPMNPDRF